VNLKNKWIVITGGSSGIGAGLAFELAARGNRVTVVAHTREHLDVVVEAIRERGGKAEAIVCDLAQPDQIDALASALLSESVVPDVLINNAGFGTYTTFEAASIDEIQRLLDVNLGGHVRLTKHLCASMAARGSGAISFMASIAGLVPITPNATYCAAKHGMIGLAEALRIELERFHVEVTAVCPGRVDTEFFSHETFRTRTVGPENNSAMPVSRAVGATIDAIESNRRLTYVPASLGLGTWLFNALPMLTRPLFSRMMRSRMERLYADARR
jgi:short-subunit dehydrogenase